VTERDLLKLATYDERERAYSHSSAEAVQRLAAAHRLRERHEYVGAGIIERDACAMIRMASHAELCRIVAERLGLALEPDLGYLDYRPIKRKETP